MDLDKAIARLELERNIKLEEIKYQLEVTFDSMKPINILKEKFEDLKHSNNLKSSVLQTVASLAGGYLSKKILIGKSHSFFKTILGYALQFGVTKFISNRVEANTQN
ncbi:hypothetical protein [Mariniflexile sp.]|uniref:hypothetical protein n=1 Tax=Mariniflexile sp. TaxID=1979402 RepID=UPI004047D79B